MPLPQLEKPVVLVGMMGAGKSAVGRALAAALGAPFHDSDAEIEALFGKPVPQIFADEGEAAFRRLEETAVTRLLLGEIAVIAAGGGAMLSERTRGQIAEDAIGFWIDADPGVMFERALLSRRRPLLDRPDARAAFHALYEERKPFYAKATRRIANEGPSPQAAVEAILAALGEHDGG
jgi:shikimate kinase